MANSIAQTEGYGAGEKTEGKIVAVRHIQDHGRIQIPKKIRSKLKLAEGDEAYWIEDRTGKFYLCKSCVV